MKQPVIFFLLFLLVPCFATRAQVFPVQGNAALIPPYSVHMADYTTRSQDRLVLNLLLANETRPELPVRLRIRIEGQNIKLETKAEYIGSAIILQGRVPLRLTGSDLLEYFRPENLNFTGITQREFEKTGALPQGFYQFCFEVLEYNRGIKISNTICSPGWLILNDPPLVNIPRNNEKLRATVPQNVIFQWTPRHTGSPNSAFSTEYEITMVELWPANRNPNDAILTSPPILETTTRATSFIYGPAETPLELGRHYAFRVRAKSIVGVEEYELFKNNGYSEVFTFVYGDVCEVPLNASAKAAGSAGFAATWDTRFNHTSFQVQYREANNAKAEWFTATAALNEVSVSSLKSNTLYEYQISASCGAFESPLTEVATIRTNAPPAIAYSCGLPMETFNLDPANLIAALNVGDVIQAGDFDVELTRVSGGNGTFSGDGVVVVPYLNNVKVKTKFTDIMVNQQKRLVKGYMNVTGAALDLIPDEVTALMDDLDETLDKIEEGLNKAEDIANQVDAALDQVQLVINEIQAYLPDDILQEIKAAQTEIATARTEMKNATTEEAKVEAKLEVKAGRDKLKDAAGKALQYYAQAVKDMIRILKESLQELVQENQRDGAETENTLSTAETELKTIEDQQNQNLFGAAGGTGSVASTDLAELIWEDNQSQPSNRSFDEAAKKYLQAERKYNLLKLILLFGTEFSSEEALRKLGSQFKSDGQELLKFIATKLKERENTEEIKRQVKVILLNNISVLLYKSE